MRYNTNMEDLRNYVDVDGVRYFLAVNRDAYGCWSAAYVDFEEGDVLDNLYFNDAANLTEVAIRMKAKLDRWKHAQAT